MSKGGFFLEIVSQLLLVWIILVGRLGVWSVSARRIGEANRQGADQCNGWALLRATAAPGRCI